jgi:hypothetical protein
MRTKSWDSLKAFAIELRKKTKAEQKKSEPSLETSNSRCLRHWLSSRGSVDWGCLNPISPGPRIRLAYSPLPLI